MIKVKIPEGLGKDFEEIVRRMIAVEVTKKIEERIREAERLMEIFQKSQMSEEDGRKLAGELAEAIARRHGVL
ncbi:hypothetical protein [Pyrococcus kukulkanii]|uniref:Antitoxin n=1 Tax=Pyrococcus kukulkanii TaxID=1609559 RepID=A0ABV4T3P6_9EURY